MSNGGLRSSAMPETKNTTAATPCHGSHHQVHDDAMPDRERVPAAIAALDAASTNGSSYAISCAAARTPPISAYLLALDQPAMSTPMMPTLTKASATNRPMSRLVALPQLPGPTGITTRTSRYGRSATNGASSNTRRSAALG